MAIRNRGVKVILFTGLLFAGHGCDKMLGRALTPFAGRGGELLKGTWVGKLESVPFTDVEGRTYQAAALLLEDGPVVEKAGDLAKGPVPLLRTWDLPHQILDPKGLPVGSRVKVIGHMMVSSVLTPPSNAGDTSGITSTGSLGTSFNKDANELVIILKGNPKVLE